MLSAIREESAKAEKAIRELKTEMVGKDLQLKQQFDQIAELKV